uniref:Uncharacterized protein n=1 Tax=Aegilops tauschii subsp. strangulata TaxID=200361 RepID=A0A453KPQ6_AEGTS
ASSARSGGPPRAGERRQVGCEVVFSGEAARVEVRTEWWSMVAGSTRRCWCTATCWEPLDGGRRGGAPRPGKRRIWARSGRASGGRDLLRRPVGVFCPCWPRRGSAGGWWRRRLNPGSLCPGQRLAAGSMRARGGSPVVAPWALSAARLSARRWCGSCLRRRKILAVLVVGRRDGVVVPGRAGGGSWTACPRRAGCWCSVHFDHNGEVLRRRRFNPALTTASILRKGWEVADCTDENPARLRSVLAATAPMGVVPLLGGVA